MLDGKIRFAIALMAIAWAVASPARGEDRRPEEPAAEATSGDGDPIEGFNRGVFWFNDQVDIYVLEPTARGWHWLLPDPVERSVSNFFQNVRFPVFFANDVLQGKLQDAGVDVGRFAINTTVGVLGLFDPATGWGLEANIEDFGQTLGWWGMGPGPYVVLPLLGPSNPRDVIGIIVDIPLAVYPIFAPTYVTISPRVVEVVNTRAQFLDEVEQAKSASLDYYVFVKDAYAQRRKAEIDDQAVPTGADQDDLYYPGVEEPSEASEEEPSR